MNINLGIGWFVGYTLHLIADSCTKMGVPFLYPFIKRRYGIKLIKTDGFVEKLFLLTLIYIVYILIKD